MATITTLAGRRTHGRLGASTVAIRRAVALAIVVAVAVLVLTATRGGPHATTTTDIPPVATPSSAQILAAQP